MDHRLFTNPDEIFHGLSDIFLCPDSVSGLLTSVRPATQWKVAGAAIGLSSLQSAFLAGGDSMPTAAQQTIELSGSITPGATLAVTLHNIPVLGSLVTGPFEDLTFEYDLQSADSLTAAMTALKAIFDAVAAGTGALTNGRLRCTNPNATRAQIATGLALKYDATHPLGTTGAVGTLKGAAAGGTVQNEYDFTVEVKPKPPGIVSLSTDMYPTKAGIFHAAATTGLTFDFSATENEIDTDQDFSPLTTYVSKTASKVTANALQDLSPRLQRVVAGLTGVGSSNNYEIVIPNLFQNAQTYGMIVVTDSQRFPGNKDIAVMRKIRGASLKLTRSKVNAPLQLSAALQKVSGIQDTCFFQLYSPSYT